MENIEYVLPGDIEKRSFEIISRELEERNIVLPKDQELVTKRVIHTSADCKGADPKWCGYCNRHEYGSCGY